MNILRRSNLGGGGATHTGIASALEFEAQAGDPNSPRAFQGNLTVEALLGSGCTSAGQYICNRAKTLKGVVASDDIVIRTIDYPLVGTVGQGRAVAETLFATGKNVAEDTPLTASGPSSYTEGFALDDPAAPWNGSFPRSAGFVLDWGLSMLNWAPFNLTIRSINWFGLDGQRLDRQATVRVQRSNGNTIYLPWASREDQSMAMAQQQIALPLPLDEGGLPQSFIEVDNLPATIAADFSPSVSFLTAFSPQMAAFAAQTNLYGNILGGH
jgi:hypothetical protein